jgi:hypothetical protein
LGNDPEGRVKFEGASQEYELWSEESEGEENNREVEHDPPDSSSPLTWGLIPSILTFTFDPSLRTTIIQRVVLDFPIVFLPFRLLTWELIPPTRTFRFDPRYRAQSRSPSPRKGDKQGCFHCRAMGHFKRECPRLGSPTGEKRVSFQGNKEALNSKGATRETWANIHSLKEVKEGGVNPVDNPNIYNIEPNRGR